MNELVKIQEDQVVTSSRTIAEVFEKRHDNVLKDIDSLIEGSPKNIGSLFYETSYTHPQNNQEYREYLLTRDGFSLLAMGFTGKKALEWKLKYIEAFNKMENIIKKPKSALEMLELQFQAIKEVDSKVDTVNEDLQEFKKDMPLLALECDRITTAVRGTGVRCLGGKESDAYQDRSLRGKVYSDIYNQLKREFGVTSYKAIKRSQSQLAVDIVKSYKLPFALYDEINDYNAQLHF